MRVPDPGWGDSQLRLGYCSASISASLMAANEVLLRARVLSLGGSPALQVPLALHLGEASAKRQPPSCHVDNGCLR